MVRPVKINSNLAAVFAFEVIGQRAHDGKCHTDCTADDGDDVEYRNCTAICRYCSNPNCCNDAFDCMMASSMWDTLDMWAVSNDDNHRLDSLQVYNKI